MPIAARLLSTFIKLQNLTNNYLSIQIYNIIVGRFPYFFFSFLALIIIIFTLYNYILMGQHT